MLSFRYTVLLLASFISIASAAVKMPGINCKMCKNGGKCSVVAVNSTFADFECDCPTGYSGKVCAIKRPEEWRGKSCTQDADCAFKIPKRLRKYEDEQAMPVCFKGKCLCRVGYFYSVKHYYCRKYCPQSDLQKTYSVYRGGGIVGHNDYVFHGTAEACERACARKRDCENFEIRGNVCYGSLISGGAEVGFVDNTPDWTHYQRNCA